jgi:hypothetical protein
MWNRVLKVLLFAAALAALMQAIRLLLVEPDEMAQTCLVDATQWPCQIRNLAIQGFARHLYGPISIAAALLAWLGGIRVFAVVAMLSGMAGMVLYDFELAALGFTLGALLLARDAGSSDASANEPIVEQNAPTQ